MVKISKEQLEKFKVLYKNRFGKEISDQETLESGTKLVRLIELIYNPMTEEEFKQLEKRRKKI